MKISSRITLGFIILSLLGGFYVHSPTKPHAHYRTTLSALQVFTLNSVKPSNVQPVNLQFPLAIGFWLAVTFGIFVFQGVCKEPRALVEVGAPRAPPQLLSE